MSFITIRNLRRQYTMGDTVLTALDGLNLDVDKGEFLCLMGPSGSGKSTLLNLLGGLDSPNDGSIEVNGQEIASLDANELARYRQRQVGFIFQSFNLIASMTALQNVEYPMLFSGIDPHERARRATRLLTKVGLGDRLKHKPTEMSGGQQQRVAIARSMVNEPDILLSDEPTGNLDSKIGEEIMDMLTGVNRRGQTVIMVTHDPRLATYATRTIHMLDGRIVLDDLRSPAGMHQYA